MQLLEIKNERDQQDVQLMVRGMNDLKDLQELGKRLNAGSIIVKVGVEQLKTPEWVLTLAKNWAKVDDATVFRALMENWSPKKVRDYLDLDLDLEGLGLERLDDQEND